MNIAFISYEFPPETGGGGIGTYLELAINKFNETGHLAIVFCGTDKTEVKEERKNVIRVPSSNWREFDNKVVEVFKHYHHRYEFNVIEGTDFQGCGLSIKKSFPQIPLIVRLHTPLYLVDKLSYQPLPLMAKIRFILGSLKRFKIPKLSSSPIKKNYKHEFDIIAAADKISSPSISIYEKLKSMGFAVENKTDIIPLPFDINLQLQLIKPRITLENKISIIYFGRLEKRKGVIDLADAIPQVLKQYPNAIFTFVGAPSFSPKNETLMDDFLKEKLINFKRSVEFIGKVPHSHIIDFLQTGDIFVFPSHYESFGIACCEAMAAGKAIIGSKEGGLAEILNFGECGLLIEPKQPHQISAKINTLIENDELRLSLGNRARKRIELTYNCEQILKMQLENYESAIKSVKNEI
ncbi:glycogen(starch) synthase [Pedobacter sp. W3I1]|uniref:glycosyltransferase family 4 protein n=1 Tax=Pedobacter sp. W3I1 TaxID=3042291 RepID=UPI00278388F0|nr:glycosyltransferase family 4 protein [Pedobacter sp. W3I1]MDQ0640906.1 glycogen(starch) synthase [Pedobacter sp. W3I1]